MDKVVNCSLSDCWILFKFSNFGCFQVIVALYPKLAPIAEKVLEIFLFLSAGNHERSEVTESSVAMETDTEHDQSIVRTGWKQRGSRMVSTR